MAKIKCKGTTLKQDLANTYTAIAQIISLNFTGMESETYESDTLDNADKGIPYDVTDRVEGGSIGGEMFFDPALAGHKSFLDNLETPAKENYQVVFADAGNTTWNCVGAGLQFGVTVALNDGLKATFSIKLDKIPTGM